MITRKCIYMELCCFNDNIDYIDNLYGCLKANMFNKKEEAENPKKSRHKTL